MIDRVCYLLQEVDFDSLKTDDKFLLVEPDGVLVGAFQAASDADNGSVAINRIFGTV